MDKPDSQIVTWVLGVSASVMTGAGSVIAFLHRGWMRALREQIEQLANDCDDLKTSNSELKQEADECREDRKALFVHVAKQSNMDPRKFRETVHMEKRSWEDESDNPEWEPLEEPPKLSLGKSAATQQSFKRKRPRNG